MDTLPDVERLERLAAAWAVTFEERDALRALASLASPCGPDHLELRTTARELAAGWHPRAVHPNTAAKYLRQLAARELPWLELSSSPRGWRARVDLEGVMPSLATHQHDTGTTPATREPHTSRTPATHGPHTSDTRAAHGTARATCAPASVAVSSLRSETEEGADAHAQATRAEAASSSPCPSALSPEQPAANAASWERPLTLDLEVAAPAAYATTRRAGSDGEGPQTTLPLPAPKPSTLPQRPSDVHPGATWSRAALDRHERLGVWVWLVLAWWGVPCTSGAAEQLARHLRERVGAEHVREFVDSKAAQLTATGYPARVVIRALWDDARDWALAQARAREVVEARQVPVTVAAREAVERCDAGSPGAVEASAAFWAAYRQGEV